MATKPLEAILKLQRGFEITEQEVTVSLLRTNDLLQHRFSRLFRQFGLTQPQYNILRILRGAGRELPSLEIAARMISVVPAITVLLDKLEKKELIRRQRCDSDRRVWHVHLTEKGASLLEDMDEPNRALHERLIGHLSGVEQTQLLGLLQRVRESFESEGDLG